MEERRDLGLDVIERELEANEDHTSPDEVTFLFAAVDIGQPGWLYDEHEWVNFDDYLDKSLELITTHFKDEKVRIMVDSKSKDVVEQRVKMMSNVEVKNVDADRLRTWRFFPAIDKIRKSEWWAASAPEAADSPLGLFLCLRMRH